MITRILLTRPEGLNETLASALQQRQIPFQIIPLIEIAPLELKEGNRLQIENLDRNDIVIFVSRHAVRFGLPMLERYWPQWPELKWFSVGSATAGELNQYGVASMFADPPGSEGLLTLPELQRPEGKQVLIVRGNGGRELLSDTLSRRGAAVRYLEVYERGKVKKTGLWQRIDEAGIDTMVVSSVEILDSLSRVCPQRLRSGYQLIASSSRIGEAAIGQGYSKVCIAKDASTPRLLEAIETLMAQD